MDSRAHAAAAAAESRWTLFDLVGSGVAVTTADGTVEYCNGALLRLLAKDADALCGTSIFALLDGGANGALQKLHRAALGTDREMRTQVRSPGRFVAGAVLRRSDTDEGQRVIWSFVDARYNEPVPELALWGTEIGLWDWDVVNDRLTWINDWCEHSQLTAFSGYGHEQLWSLTNPSGGFADLPGGDYRGIWTDKLRRTMSNTGCATAAAPGSGFRNAAASSSATRAGVPGARSACVSMPMSGTNQPVPWSTAKPAWRTPSGDPASACGITTSRTTPCVGGTIGAPTSTWTPARVANHAVRWDALVHPDDLPPFSGEYERLIAGTSETYEAEYRIRTRSGNWRWIFSRGRATARDSAGRAVRLAGATIDIDARKRMELALRGSEARLRTQALILQTMREGVVLVNPARTHRIHQPGIRPDVRAQ